MKIAVIGTGYVGLVTGACFAEFGLFVTCVDIDEKKIENLKNCKIPIYEPGLESIIRRNVSAKRLSFTTDIESSIKNNLVIFLAVGTPSNADGSADLSSIFDVSRKIAKFINSYKVIVNKSTVPIGTGSKVKEIIRNEKKNNCDFDVVSNPEFLREGSAVNDFLRPDRIVIGAETDHAIAIMKDIYSPHYLNEPPLVITNIETAEMIKYASNAFLALKISYINEIANLCDLTGSDVHKVAKAMGMDGRIGSKFLHPGPGFGGSCFPKDSRAILHTSKMFGYNFQLVETLIKVNNNQKKHAADKILRLLEKNVSNKPLEKCTVALLGLSFKPNTDDVRESPSLTIIEELLRYDISIKAYDPAAMNNIKNIFGNKIQYMIDEYLAAKDADCLAIITEWNQFRKLDMEKIKKLMKNPNLADLRNVYEPEYIKSLGFNYTCIGRETVA
ncbi:MAG: UDP-glucose/GDP-mannose dehydrogenase family protein [Deferribacterota bacterium]|nr:UDP-glucose/GDP-mannose dehydrogenase family protein [Deferribacterota bacterium]